MPSTDLKASAPRTIAFTVLNSPAHPCRYRRFACPLTGANARLAEKRGSVTPSFRGTCTPYLLPVRLAHQVFTIEGHDWRLTPGIPNSDVVSARYLPPTGVLNIELATAGGPQERPGDYMWRNQRLPFQKAGQWGLLRVHEEGDEPMLAKLKPSELAQLPN